MAAKKFRNAAAVSRADVCSLDLVALGKEKEEGEREEKLCRTDWSPLFLESDRLTISLKMTQKPTHA